jgi:ribonuclease HI
MSQNDKPKVVIYSDGGSKPNPGPGGWAAVMIFGAHQKELSGAEDDTTNNRMELTAAIEALEALNQPCSVTIHTDSTYLKDGITRWLKGWQKNNWRTYANKPVKNEDLWRRLQEAVERHDVKWKWIKGHAGDKWNEHVDQLATQARNALLKKIGDNSS